MTSAAFRHRSWSLIMMSAVLWMLIPIAAMPLGVLPACQSIANEIKNLKAERTSLQTDLQQAAPGQKSFIAAQIKTLNGQIAKKEADYMKCRQTNDLVDTCSPDPRPYRAAYPDQNSHYRLPFNRDPAWALGNGNWDDPTSGHCKPKPGESLSPDCLQPYAFDFTHPVGGTVLAARPGAVYDAVWKETGNSINDKTVYFFKGNQYLIYDSDANKVTQDYQSISTGFQNWPKGWNSVDDAVNWENGKIYFFRGSEYLRLDVSANKVDKGPLPIVGNWGGWPNWLLGKGIDAAYNWRGKAYFFRGGEYLVYDMDPKVDKVVIQPTSLTTITGWPAAWASGVDAAMVGKGKVYFFKGDKFLRYDILSQQVDSGPKNISASDWPTQLNPGVSGAVRWNGGYTGVGNYLVIKHTDGTYAVYWHLDQNGVLVKVGDPPVVRGQTIARSGNTGRSFAPHLHFEVRKGWDLGYGHTNWNEFISVPIRFEDSFHSCWVPQVGDNLVSNNP